jgi:hypothetical protein
VVTSKTSHRLLDFDPYHRPEGAPLHPLLDGLEQVGRPLLVNGDVPTPRDPEDVDPLHLTPRVERRHVRPDDLLYGDEARAIRQRDEARQSAGKTDVGEVRRPAGLVPHHGGEGQAQVGNVGERVARRLGHRLGRQHREDLLFEVGLHGLPGRRIQIVPCPERHAVPLQLRHQLPETSLLPFDQRGEPHGDRVELLLRGETVQRGLLHALDDGVLERADPHHHELVEVRSEDREETEPSQ